MNTPLLLTSVALLAGVAARPIENIRRGDDLRELTRSPGSNDRQSFVGRIPPGLDSLNTLQLHDLHDNTHMDNAALEGGRSPKLHGVDGSSDPDPGLSSPYMGPQRYLNSMEQEPAQTLISYTSTPSSPASRKPEQQLLDSEDPNYSPIVVVLVLSSLAALVLLGLTVAVVCASQLLRRAMFQENVWKRIAGAPREEKADDNNTCESENEIGGEREKQQSVPEGGTDQGVIAAKEMPNHRLMTITTDSIKPAESLVEDPDVPSLPDKPSISSATTVHNRDRDHDRNMGLALAAWTYDNWVMHFMLALFGWLGVFVGGARSR